MVFTKNCTFWQNSKTKKFTAATSRCTMKGESYQERPASEAALDNMLDIERASMQNGTSCAVELEDTAVTEYR